MSTTSNPMSNTRYAITYAGGVTTNTAVLTAATHDGPLFIARDHMLAKMMPGVFEDGGGTIPATVPISQLDVQYLMLNGVLFDAGFKEKGCHGLVRAARLANLLKDVDNAGFDDSPVLGKEETAMPVVAQRLYLAVAALPPDKRTIAVVDLCIGQSLRIDINTLFSF